MFSQRAKLKNCRAFRHRMPNWKVGGHFVTGCSIEKLAGILWQTTAVWYIYTYAYTYAYTHAYTSIKNWLKNRYDFGSIVERFWVPPGVHVGCSASSGMRSGRTQDAPRRSQEALKMLPRLSRTPIGHPNGSEEGPTHAQARFWTMFHWIFSRFLDQNRI